MLLDLLAHHEEAIAQLELDLAAGVPELRLLDRLRRSHTPDESRSLLGQAALRLKARSRGVFRSQAPLALEAEALEQASCWEVAAHRAQELDSRAAAGPVLDLGCGGGGDALELARLRAVIAVDTDPDRVELLRYNATLLALPVTALCGDWRHLELPDAAAAFVDPGRRRDGRRIFDPEGYQPPLSAVLELQAPLLCVKVAPGIPDDALPPGAEVELVSHQGSCKEAVLWFGAGARPGTRRASVCVDGSWHHLDGQASEQLPVAPTGAGDWLHEPDPALIRAHALGPLAAELHAGLIDPTLAYLVGPPGRRSPLAQSFEILEVTLLRREAIQAAVESRGWTSLEIKKRGVDIEPDEMRRKLKLGKGAKREGTLVMTRLAGRHAALLCRRV